MVVLLAVVVDEYESKEEVQHHIEDDTEAYVAEGGL